MGHLVDRFDKGDGVSEQVEILPQPRIVLDRLGLGDHVELPTLVEQEAGPVGRLQPGPEPALGLAHTLGDRPDLPAARGHQHHYPVGLAQLVGAQHDPLVPVEAHGA